MVSTSLKYSLFCAFLLVLSSCYEKQDSQKELVLQPNYSQIQDIISIADCNSPFGKYTTEVHSSLNGTCYFLQRFNDTDAPFIVKIDRANRGYLMNEQDVVIDTLSPEDVEIIRGHEIHKMSIDPGFFFDSIGFVKSIKHPADAYELYKGKDRLDHQVNLLYDGSRKLIAKIELLNPKDTTQSIEIFYDNWVPGKYGEMVREIRIVQAKKDTFHFDYQSLKVKDSTGYHTVFN